MKKTLVTALTTALVVGAASTTFANAFEDVPADHWANDAIAQLTADGVIEGYGDGTYRGDQAITRYEVAQIVARAMAKENVSAANKATIDKLASEFAEELNSLGVRVSALEKKVDNVKWTGTLRWRTINKKYESEPREKGNYLTFRLEPEATVNDHWKVNARLDAYTGEGEGDSNNMVTASNGTKVRVERAWATGTYGTTEILLGKLPYVTNVDNGMIMDDNVTGAQVNFGNEQVKATVTAGRWNKEPDDLSKDEIYDYQGIEVYNDRDAKVTWGVGYHHTGSHRVADGTDHSAGNILALGLGYKFNDCVALNGAYAHNAGFELDNESVDSSQKQAYSIELDYKGADQEQPGSYGLFAAYRHLGQYGVMAQTYDAFEAGNKGWEFGAEVCLDKNIMAAVKYGTGKKIENDDTYHHFFSEVNFFF